MTEQAFKSLVRDVAHSAVVPASRVVRSAEIAHVGGRPGTHKEAVSIELLKEDDVVRAIDVVCECGHKIRLWCSYEIDAQNQKPS